MEVTGMPGTARLRQPGRRGATARLSGNRSPVTPGREHGDALAQTPRAQGSGAFPDLFAS